MTRNETYDVIVVGSGFGGMPPALRMAEAGYRVLVLEKGSDIVPERDLRQTQSPAYVRRYIKSLSGKGINLTYAEGLGGGSAFYEMVSLRAPSIAFEQRDRNGRRLWPSALSRAALDPYYETAERMLHVEQIAEEDVPKSGLVFALMMKRLGYSCDRARYATKGCAGSGYCVTGCVFGAKQSLHVNYIPRARAAGAEVRTDTDVLYVAPRGAAAPADAPLASLPPRWEVVCRDAAGLRERLYARLVVLAAGTVGSAALLLRSKRHLPRLGRHVGRHIAFNGSVKAVGLLPDDVPDGDFYTGRSHPGIVTYEFLESHGVMVTSAKPLPLQMIAGARLAPAGADPHEEYWGAMHVDLLRRIRHRAVILYATGLTPPGARIRLHADGAPSLSLSIDRPLRSYHDRVHALLESLLVRAGCTLLPVAYVDGTGTPYDDLHYFTAHQTGSCRMADSPHHGVTNAGGEVFGYPGLYVSDGATVPTSLAVNSSLTVLANAERIAEGLVARFGGRPPADREPPVATGRTEGVAS